MNARARDLLTLTMVAIAVTLALAAPVVLAPTERIFGRESVGRHHDPFTVMTLFEHPRAGSPPLQPLTDLPGAYAAQRLGPVAAYNLLVLVSFPLSAVAAFVLARHLAVPPVAAGAAAMMFAFAPFHLAHAAYHQHVAQTQWLPFYLLALWRCLDAANTGTVVVLIAAALAVVLSNLYGGLIAATVTPIAVASYWWFHTRERPRASFNLAVTVVVLSVMLVVGVAVVASTHSLVDRATFAFPRTDVVKFSATWWSYLTPPVAHPILGRASERFWTSRGVGEGLLEQQVSVGWAATALAMTALWAWWQRRRRQPREARIGMPGTVPVLATVAVWAGVCSLTPQVPAAGLSDLLYPWLPMFRAYARFGVIVQLMVALLAAMGAAWLWQRRSRRAQVACIALLALTVAEYAVWPPALWRDVLPTRAHRWVATRAGAMHALDCAAFTPDSASIPWLTNRRIAVRHPGLVACSDPDIARHASALGYTHLIVRRPSREDRLFERTYVPDGLRTVISFDDSVVLAMVARLAPVHTAAARGFHQPEREGGRTWRWMGRRASWVLVNPGAVPATVSGSVMMKSFSGRRHVRVLVDDAEVQTLSVEGARQYTTLGPLTIAPGPHEVVLSAVEPPTAADHRQGSRDRRQLTVAVSDWVWAGAEGTS